MSMAYSSTFALGVMVGYLLTLLGAMLSLLAGVWWMLADEWRQRRPLPLGFRALVTTAFGLFVLGIFWQLIGYLTLEYTGRW
jgi:hypothetical protein